MERYDDLKRDLARATTAVEALIDEAEKLPGGALRSAAKWRRTCEATRLQMTDERIRVAVVGPIKSGKSTFTNALLGGDYLKRGAGVVTSIVTRIRRGEALSADLHFKSWEEINDDIRRALALFPGRDWRGEDRPFDLRSDADRSALEAALRGLDPEQLVTDDARNANSALLFSYLNGFDRAAEKVGEESAVVRFDGSRFAEHRSFAGEDALAAYLRDICLTVPFGGFDSPLELADCQGSDSPNPHHLAMIQEYLLTAHLIVYVISSRTGLRRADLHFLSIIRKMGIADHLMFVLNVDLGEHESDRDLADLEGRTRDELALMVPDPVLFPLSALYHLLVQREDLPEADRLRIRQWEAAPDLITRSTEGFERFRSEFSTSLTADSLRLLLSNPSERLHRIADDLAQLTAVRRQMMEADAGQSKAMLARVRGHIEEMGRVQGILRSTLAGGREKIQRELRSGIDRFFDDRAGEVIPAVLDFIRNYTLAAAGGTEEILGPDGFQAALYRCYQAFRRDLETHLAENANPTIVRFVREMEERIAGHLEELAAPYRTLVRDAVDGTGRILADGGVATRIQADPLSDARLDMAAVRREANLAQPSLQAVMHYSATVKTEAVARLGVYRLWRWCRRLLRRRVDAGLSEERLALEDGLRRLRKETEAALRFHFKDVRENIKFGYLFKLLDAGIERLAEEMLDRIQTYTVDLEQVVDSVRGDKAEMAGRTERLLEISRAAEDAAARLEALRERIRGTA
jgi:hypothetical protein